MPHKKAKRSIREKTKSEQGTDLEPTNLKTPLRDEPIPKSAHRILNAMSIREDFKKKRKASEEGRDEGVKRKKGDGDNVTGKGSDGKKKSTPVVMKIQPGESIQHFNRRVEDDLRPLVKNAVQASRVAVRNAVKEEKEAKAQAKKEREEKAAAAKLRKAAGSDAEDDDDDSPPSKSHKPSKHARSSASPPPPVDKHASSAKEFATISSSTPRRLNDIALAPPEFKKLPRGATPTSAAGSAMGRGDGVLSMAQKLMMEKERENAILRYRELKASRMIKEGRDQ